MNCEDFVVEELKKARNDIEELKYSLEISKDLYDCTLKDLITLLEIIEHKTTSEGEDNYYLSEWDKYRGNYEKVDKIYKKYIPNEESFYESEKQ